MDYADHLVKEPWPTSATYRKVLPMYEAAGEKNIPQANLTLAKIHIGGFANGIMDEAKGIIYLEKAAKGGLSEAQFILGIKLLAALTETPERLDEALNWLRSAAYAGHLEAQNRLSGFLFRNSTKQSALVEAASWHLQAAVRRA